MRPCDALEPAPKSLAHAHAVGNAWFEFHGRVFASNISHRIDILVSNQAEALEDFLTGVYACVIYIDCLWSYQ